MSLIKCNECGKEISDTSKTCIHCGNPIEKKIICSECNKEVNHNIKVCPHCGNKLVKSAKEKISDITNKNNIFKKLGKKKLIIISICVVVILCIISIPIIINKNNTKAFKNIYGNLLVVSDDIEVIASDLYSSWHYGIYEDYHSKYYLSDEVSLDYDDLDNYYCSYVYKDEWIYSVRCVTTAHEDLGHYKDIKKILDSTKTELSNISNRKSETYKELNNFYINLNNYYKLSKEYDGSFNSLKDDISNYRNLIKNNISKLDLLLNFDSESYISANKNSNNI